MRRSLRFIRPLLIAAWFGSGVFTAAVAVYLFVRQQWLLGAVCAVALAARVVLEIRRARRDPWRPIRPHANRIKRVVRRQVANDGQRHVWRTRDGRFLAIRWHHDGKYGGFTVRVSDSMPSDAMATVTVYAFAMGVPMVVRSSTVRVFDPAGATPDDTYTSVRFSETAEKPTPEEIAMLLADMETAAPLTG